MLQANMLPQMKVIRNVGNVGKKECREGK